MEVRARYTLMGLFAVGLILAVFGFVYWLDAAGGLSRRSAYLIRFDGPVAGLLRGSAVLFNGVRVGEVTNLTLDPAQPQVVMAAIAIDQEAPVRTDTKVLIDFQGLTGAPVVSLVGGTATEALARAGDGSTPLLIAEKNAGQGMTQVAREVLRKLDGVIAENAEPLRNTIGSINAFSAALARNSDKVDGIFAGLERLTGGGKKLAVDQFDISPARITPGPARVPAGQLLVAEPTALALLDAERVRVGGPDAEKLGLGNARWPDLLSKVVQLRIIQSFEAAGYPGAIGRTLDEVKTDHRLLTSIREFGLVTGTDPAAVVELAGKLVDQEGRVLADQVFRASLPLSELNGPAAMQTLDKAAQNAFAEIVLWACGVIPEGGSRAVEKDGASGNAR
jgi:phospholipid/cholesterol/gamma-HCH transport system substrate-binding protein